MSIFDDQSKTVKSNQAPYKIANIVLIIILPIYVATILV